MITTNFQVKKRKISQVESEVPFTGEYNIDTFQFQFDDEWQGLDKTLVMIVNNQRYNVALLNDMCVVPYNFYDEKDNILIGIFGTDGENQTLATGWLPIYIEDDAYARGVEPENLPTQTQWDLFVTEINGLLEQCQATKQQCQDILDQMGRDYTTYIGEFNQIKQDTLEYKNQTQEILEDVEDIKQDIIDMGSARFFATFYLDPTTGDLYVVGAESLGNMGFSVQDGDLYVNINSEVV